MTAVRLTTPGHGSPVERARLSLEGLSVGDAFGEQYFGSASIVVSRIESRTIPKPPWHWTDDTAMALSIFEALSTDARIDPDALAARFAARFMKDPRRGYGGTAQSILAAIGQGAPWREESRRAFDGQGSMGNGGAMRSAPIGAYFADDLDRVIVEAAASAEPTHAHAEGRAGAVAVAVAAALASQMGSKTRAISGDALLRETLSRTPAGDTRDGIEKALTFPFSDHPREVALILGSGSRVISSDTVPFSLWCAACHLSSYEAAMWATVSGLGDRDTTCAIVGGIVAMCVGIEGIPRPFIEAREALDSELGHEARYEERNWK